MSTKIKDTLAMKRFLNFLSIFWSLKRYLKMLFTEQTFDSNITTCWKYMVLEVDFFQKVRLVFQISQKNYSKKLS